MTATRSETVDAPLYVSHVTVRMGEQGDKLATMPSGAEEVVMGTHGAIAEHLGAGAGHRPHNTTLDYVVAATVACLAGTFTRGAKARGIEVTDDTYAIEGDGDVHLDRDVLVLKRIVVRHTLRVAPEQREAAERLHDVYQRGCAVSRSIEAALEIDSELVLLDAG